MRRYFLVRDAPLEPSIAGWMSDVSGARIEVGCFTKSAQNRLKIDEISAKIDEMGALHFTLEMVGKNTKGC